VTKAEQIFDLLLKEKQLKLPENHKLPMAQELQGRLYCKWHHSFTHSTGECKELRRQIQSAIEQGRLILAQHTMKVDTKPFPQANMVELSDLGSKGQDLAFQINMVGPVRRHDKQRREAASGKQDRRELEQQHVTEEQVRHIRNQLPASNRLLEKYQYQHKLHRRYKSEDAGKAPGCTRPLALPVLQVLLELRMSRLPTIDDCLECRPRGHQQDETSVFRRLGPGTRHDDHVRRPTRGNSEQEEEEDRYHRPRWCPDGLNRSQKRRVQRLRNLEEAEAKYLDVLRKARPDLAEQIKRPQREEGRPPRKEWRPKQTKADEKPSADVNMVFVLPSEFRAPQLEESAVAQLDLGPQPIIFEKPKEKSYKHLKGLYLKGFINGKHVNRMLVDTGAAVNLMPYSVMRRLGRSSADLIKTNVMLNDFNGQPSEAMGVLNVELKVGRKTVPTSFFIVNSKSTYTVLLGRDWIHANCCIPSTMHQYLVQWDGDEVEVVHADNSSEVSLADMNAWDADGQEPISRIALEDCDRIEATKNGLRLVLSTGLTE